MPSASSYWLSQSARVGWFLGQYLLSNRLRRSGAAASRPSQARVRTPEKTADRRRRSPSCWMTSGRLLRRDWSNIRDGLYHLPSRPADGPGGSLPTRWRSLRTSRRRTSAAVATASTTSGVCPRPISPPFPTTTCATSIIRPAAISASCRQALRPAGRGAVHRQRRCDAPPGTGADRRLRPAPARPSAHLPGRRPRHRPLHGERAR